MSTPPPTAPTSSCLTSASEPYLHAADVGPGTTIAAVGSDTPEKRELSTELLASATLICDVTHQCAHAGELHHALESGVITLADVRGEIGEVIVGKRDGRRTQDEIIVFDSTGTAVQDTAPAAALHLATKHAPKAHLWAMN